MRLGSAGEPLRGYISQPPPNGPSTFQSLRLPSAVRTNAPLRVPTRTRTPLMSHPSLSTPSSPYDDPPTGNSSFADPTCQALDDKSPRERPDNSSEGDSGGEQALGRGAAGEGPGELDGVQLQRLAPVAPGPAAAGRAGQGQRAGPAVPGRPLPRHVGHQHTVVVR